MKKCAAVFLLAGLMMPAMAQPSFADWDHNHAPHGHAHHVDWDRHWHGDIHHFNEHDLGYWRSGHWWHGRHGGRLGWWWMLGDSWYFYPHPIYPVPYPYLPPVAVTPPPGIDYYYYCGNPAGYYPYVPECFTGWREVPVR